MALMLSSLKPTTPLQHGGVSMADQLIKGNYVALPEKTILSKAWKELQPSTRCVYTTMLLDYYRTGKNASDEVTWSQADLAEATGLSLRTVKRGTTELRSKEWIEIVSIGCRWSKGTTYKVNALYANGETPKPTK